MTKEEMKEQLEEYMDNLGGLSAAVPKLYWAKEDKWFKFDGHFTLEEFEAIVLFVKEGIVCNGE